jgi:8-oxo-dGTP diphosphatase
VSAVTEPDHLDLIRRWFAAYNRGDLGAIAALYDEEIVDEQGGVTRAGRAAVVDYYQQHFHDWQPGLDNGLRRRVRTVARIETGWVHAEWFGRERRRGETVETDVAGYDHFLVERGRITRQRGVAHEVTPGIDDEPVAPPAGEPRRRSRSYPTHPIVGVGAVIVQGGEVVLIRRRFEPLKGQWSLPGGTLELGETLEAGVAREMLEETGLVVEVGPVVEVFDRILMDEDRRVRYHFVLVDYLCRPVGGTLAHGSDVDAAVLVPADRLPEYRLTPKALSVILRGLDMAREHRWEG